MTTKVTKVLSGTITDIAFKFSAKGTEYTEVSVLPAGTNYALKCRTFDPEGVEWFKKARKGAVISLNIEEEPGMFQNKPIVYRNIVGLTESLTNAIPEEPQFPVAGTTTKPPTARPEGGTARSAPLEAPSQPQQPASPPSAFLERPTLSPGADKYSAAAVIYEQDQMNRRTGLMQAMQGGGTDDEVEARSDRWYKHLRSAPTEEPA